MSTGNPVSNFISKYQSKVKSPLAQAAIIGGVSIPFAFLAKKPIYRLLKNRVRDPRVSQALFGMDPYQATQSIQQMQNSWLGKWGTPLLLGSMPALASLAPNIVPDAPMLGLTSWNPKGNRKKKQENKNTTENNGLSKFGAQSSSMKKTNSLSKEAQLFQSIGYQPQLDLTKSINRQQAINMVNTNPFLLQQDPYARHLGTSIITAAPVIGNQVTLGGIYDSAVNKFDNKLQFQGVGNKVVKGVVSGALAGMFTDVVGTVIGMPQRMRIGLSNTVGVGKALHSILT